LSSKRIVRIVVLVAVLSLVAAACSSKKSGNNAGTVKKGGTVTIGVEQWPQCVNPVTECASASWNFWAIYGQTLMGAMRYDPTTGGFNKTDLITETPTVANGDLKTTAGGGMVLTFKINPAAVWDDGSPITSKDFAFTWKAMEDTKASYYAAGSGYDLITGVDTSDPHTAVITYKKIYADWGDDFGGLTYVLKAAAFPTVDPNKPDLSKVMQTDLPFSSGPWKLQSWSKTQEVLVPNTNYWVKSAIPNLDKIVMVPREDQPTEINSLLSGEIDAAAPQPGNVSIVRQIASNANLKSDAEAGAGGFYESIWYNDYKTTPVEKGTPNPLADPKVREALSYAVDRESVNTNLVQLNSPNSQVLNCGYLSYPGTAYCAKTYFDQFTYNPAKSVSILQADGYDCSKVASGQPCSKNGVPLVLKYRTTAGNPRRSTTQDLLVQKFKGTGFGVDIKNSQSTQLFTDIAPKGDFSIADFAQGGTIDPSATGGLSCNSVPLPSNSYGGNNFDHYCDPALDALMANADAQLDQTMRVAAMEKVYAYEAAHFIFLPMYVLPNMLVWNNAKIGSTESITKWVPSAEGPLYGLNTWYLK
jgi:peptide/nickel transport system substrate-binding protein